MKENKINFKTIVEYFLGLLLTIVILLGIYLIIGPKRIKNFFTNNDSNEITKEQEISNNAQSGDERNSFYNIEYKLENGILSAIVGDYKISMNGIDGEVKSFLKGSDCGSYFYVLALTTDNKIFFSYFNYSDKVNNENNHLDFEKIEINDNIVGISKINYAGFRTCNDHDFGVILENGELRALTTFYGSDIGIGKFNYAVVKFVTLYWPSIVLYNDNTISQLLDNPYDGPIKEKLSCNGEILVLDKYININDDGLSKSYIISNNKLYALSWIPEDNSNKGIERIELISNSEIASESLESLSGENDYNNNNQVDIIRFKDGTSFEIKDIIYIYNNK